MVLNRAVAIPLCGYRVRSNAVLCEFTWVGEGPAASPWGYGIYSPFRVRIQPNHVPGSVCIAVYASRIPEIVVEDGAGFAV
jgi:hypothetical protein